MKGIIFNAFESAVGDLLSEDAWDDVLDAAGVEGCYTAIGTYDDVELERILTAVARISGLTTDEVLVAVGRRAYRYLAERYPDLTDGITTTIDLLTALNEIIHPGVRRLYPDARPPRFDIDVLTENVVRLRYSSDRDLSAFAEGLLHGGADSFGEEITVTPVARDGSCTVVDIAVARMATVQS